MSNAQNSREWYSSEPGGLHDMPGLAKEIQNWATKHGSVASGAILIALRDDGFDVQMIGPDPISTEEVLLYVQWVAAEMTRVMGPGPE